MSGMRPLRPSDQKPFRHLTTAVDRAQPAGRRGAFPDRLAAAPVCPYCPPLGAGGAALRAAMPFTFMPPGRIMSPPVWPGAQGPVQVALTTMVWAPFMAAMGAPVVVVAMVAT